MKKYGDISLRQGKTDRMDSLKNANYGIDNWYHLTEYLPEDEAYSELRLLSRQYLHYTSLKIKAKVNLTSLLDKTMPGVKPLLRSQSDFSSAICCAASSSCDCSLLIVWPPLLNLIKGYQLFC